MAWPQPRGRNRRGQAKKDKARPCAVPAVMMRDRADTEADLGTRPPLGETRDFSGAGSLEPPRRRPRPASRARGVECRAPVLLLRRRAWLRAAVSAGGQHGWGLAWPVSPLCPSALREQSSFLCSRRVHRSASSWPFFRQFPLPTLPSCLALPGKLHSSSPLLWEAFPHPSHPYIPLTAPQPLPRLQSHPDPMKLGVSRGSNTEASLKPWPFLS